MSGVETRRIAGNRPVMLGPEEAAVVREGEVDAFLQGPGGERPELVASLAPGDVASAGELDGSGRLVLRGAGEAAVAVGPGGLLAEMVAAPEEALEVWRARVARFEAGRVAAEDPAERAERRRGSDRDAERTGRRALREALEGEGVPERPAGLPPLALALLEAADAAGAAVDPGRVEALARSGASLEPAALAAALRVPARRVTLDGRWWREEGAPMLAARGGEPIALIPRRGAGFDAFDPAKGERERVTEQVARDVDAAALVAYPRLPDRPLGLRDLVRPGGGPASRRDLAVMAAAGVIAAILAAAIPIATSNVVGFVLPRDDRSALAGTTALLVALLLGTLVAGVAQGIALLRLATRLDLRLTAAIWDRALHLSPAFFRRFAAGELGRRLLAIDELRQLVTGATVAAGAAALFGFASLVVMVVYAPLLGLVTLGVVAVAGALVALWLRRERRDVREMIAHRNAIAGMLLGMLSGIAKIRVAGAERRAQAAWARRFARQALAERRSVQRQVQIAAIAAALPAAAAFAAIGVAVAQGNTISPASLAGFATALGQFSAAVLLVVPLAQTLLAAGPIYDTARPVLAEVPETGDAAADPGRLEGEVELASVSFRYGPDAPPALDGVSLTARAGEFVAIVGPSGSGKSTLVRILLGFDVPETGSVLLDGRELEGLDLQAVRRQMGTVIQGAGLSPGTIATNITGASVLDEEAIWRAIERVGLAADVRRMPMGLHTLVSEGGAGFSGGQAQRILLARALVRDPRIVILDEATAYLDNETQRQVTETLAELGATRIVIAHRLSTIRDADRIYVMEGGRVVEQGSHDDLLAAGGPFARLARRQMIEAAPGD